MSAPAHSTVLSGRPLLLARAAWATLAALALALCCAAVPAYYAQLSTPPETVRANLAQAGLSVGDYAGYTITLTVVFAVSLFGVAGVIAWRRSDDWMALFVSLFLVLLGAVNDPLVDALVIQHPALFIPARFAYFLTIASLFLFFFLFPDGRFVPRWLRVPVLVWLTGFLFIILGLSDLPLSVIIPLMVSGIGAGVLAQIYRFRRVSDPVQRQQTKWVVFGLAAMFALILAGSVVRALMPALAQPGLATLTDTTMLTLAFLLLPLSLKIAILRFRLWDVDPLIRRTLIYGLLTALLLAVYLAGIVLLQGLFRSLLGQENNLAVVVATLAAVALFQPLRSHIQAFIDRRFYRRKYDAARTLAAFSAQLRDDVDLASLANELVSVVEETMQPAHVSLWLRPTPPPAPASGGEHSRRSVTVP